MVDPNMSEHMAREERAYYERLTQTVRTRLTMTC